MKKRPTLQDLANEAGVSIATVDRVLNGRKSVRTTTAIRVLDAAKAMGFHAANLIEKRVLGEIPNITVGLILHSPELEFYRQFEKTAIELAAKYERANIRLIISFLPSQSPTDVVKTLASMAKRVHIIGMVAIDHPLISEAVALEQTKGVKVFSVLSEFAQGIRTGYLGLNNIRVGRTAAWMLSRGKSGAAKFALFTGGHRWHGQDLREAGFRSWLRQNRRDVEVLDTQIILHTSDLAYESTISLLAKHDDIDGIYCTGGGLEGIIEAVKDEKRHKNIDIIAQELTTTIRHALGDGMVSMAISTPLITLCNTLFDQAVASTTVRQDNQALAFLPMKLDLLESI